ncbi:hypothetical protein [Pseudomonas sp. Kh13]|uniref:hypothetical protein n=1 Tax=Pseudomonas sp. Kh13 TaxID=2093744 RepID=UPI0015B7588F|nr:hypothetical protein [Pseudomonas sp. Kh13]
MQTQLKLVLAAVLAGSALMAHAEEKHHAGDATASAPAASTTSESAMNKVMSEQMHKMQVAHDQAAAAKTPAERRAAMHEGMRTMKESMAMMHQHHAAGCMGSGMGMSGAKGGMGMGDGMMDMMMKMMDQQSSMMDMPMKQ